jgi:hypothetical protein
MAQGDLLYAVRGARIQPIVNADFIAEGPRMSGLLAFLGAKKNRDLIAWLGGGIVIVIAGLWAVFVYLYPPKGDGGGSASNCNISTGGIASGNNTVNCGSLPSAPAPKP